MLANPQKEDGHIDIANEIAEKLARFQLSGNEHRILWAIWRKTWGWHKKHDQISISQLVKMTELSRRSVRRVLEELVGKNIIQKNFGRVKIAPTSINFLGFNKDYETWKARVKIAQGGQNCAENYAQNRATQKKRKKKISIKVKQEYLDLVDLLITKMCLNDPLAKVPDTPTKREKWADSFRLLIENDKRPIEEVREVLIWCQNDDFWKGNILSAGALRRQFQRLRLQMVRKQEVVMLDPAELTRKEMCQDDSN